MRERLLRFARNDNAQYVIKGIACVIARVFSEAISHFHNGELVAALLRYEITEFRSVPSGGTSFPSEDKRTAKGTWEVQIVDDEPFLVLKQDGSVVMRWRNGMGGEGIHLLDDKPWNRYFTRK